MYISSGLTLFFIYIKTDPQLINPEDIVTVTAGPFLDFTGSLLSENSTKEWNRTISHFVLRVSLCLLEVRVGGCRHRCIIDGERVSEQRWDFSPLCFFFFLYLFIAAEQPSVICWAITGAEMCAVCLWLQVCVSVCVRVHYICIYKLFGIFLTWKHFSFVDLETITAVLQLLYCKFGL